MGLFAAELFWFWAANVFSWWIFLSFSLWAGTRSG